MQHNIIQYDTMRHNTRQYNTTQRNVLDTTQRYRTLGARARQASTAGRPSWKVENSATVHAPLLGHFVAAMLVVSECVPVMLNLLACAWKFRRAASTQLPGSLLAAWLTGWLAAGVLFCVYGRKDL